MTTVCMSRSWKVQVCPKIKLILVEEMINQQSAARKGARQVRSNTNLFVSSVPTHDRLHLTGKRPQQRSQGPQQQQSTPSYRLLATTLEWGSLTTGGICIIQPSRPRGRSHSQCCCVAFHGAKIVITTTSSSFSDACACHVYIHVCMCVYLPKFNKQTHYYDPYPAVPWGFFYSNNNIFCFGTKYDANSEKNVLPIFILSTSPYIKIRRMTGEYRSTKKIARFSLGRRPSNKVM